MPATKTKSAQDQLNELQEQIAALEAEQARLQVEAQAEAAREEAANAFKGFVAAYEKDPAEVTEADLSLILKAIPRPVVAKAVARLNEGYTPTKSRASKGTRAPRLSLDDVKAKLPAKGSPWKVSDLAAAIEREVGTTRNFLPKLLEAGAIKEAGDDGGTPRPAKLYTTS